MGIPSGLPGFKEEEEYDDAVFYEDIEAPKFVDLTAPNAARATDDPSWFCLRVGCDQSHEHVDPEALDRSFFMRVMAARSPNVRLQRAISRRNHSSTMLKCPHSAPPKPPRARFARPSTAAEAAEKAESKPKLRARRICTLRASPTRAKTPRSKVELSSARNKALTTPRSKVVRPRQEPFLSVKQQKGPAPAAASKGTVAKALFMSTPGKEAASTPPAKSKEAVSEVCSKMRKLNLACREVPSRYMLCCHSSNPKAEKKGAETTATKSAKRGQQESRTKVKNVLGSLVKCANEHDEGSRNDGSNNNSADENSVTEAASSSEESKTMLQELRIEVGTLRADHSDDDKENVSHSAQPIDEASSNSHGEGENIQLENNENVPQKVVKKQNKVNAEQAGKLKTTNPKPFRLRTDLRQVLKDANPERKQPFADKNSMAVLKDANRGVKPMHKCADGKGRSKPICGDKQKKQNTHIAMGQLGEAKPALNSIRCNNVRPAMTKGKVVEKSQRVCRVASSTRATKTASGALASQIVKEKKTSVKTSRLQAAAP
ncbi:hypothetical protein ACP4OV_008089 [Aristida adscensionis]